MPTDALERVLLAVFAALVAGLVDVQARKFWRRWKADRMLYQEYRRERERFKLIRDIWLNERPAYKMRYLRSLLDADEIGRLTDADWEQAEALQAHLLRLLGKRDDRKVALFLWRYHDYERFIHLN